jgi:Flp pilus assembly pilin Flp
VAESLGVAVLELVADTRPLVAGLEKGKLASKEMAAETASGFKGGIQKAAIPAAAAVGALVIGLRKSVDAAEENQVAEAKLATAFKASGLNIDDYKSSIDAAEQSSAGLGFKSEDVKASLAQLVVATHSGSQAIQMLSTAQDVARYKGISLTDASKLLTTTMAGSARAAHTLGITMAPVTTATDALKTKTQYATLAAYEHAKATAYMTDKQATAKEMVGLLSDKLGGQADAFSKTAAGAKEKMGAEFQLLEINIGNVLIPVLTKVSTVLANFSQFLVKHAAVVKIVLAVLAPLLLGILAYTAYTKMAAAAQWLWNIAMDDNPIGLIIIAIAALVVAFVELWKHSQTFRDIVLGVWSAVTTATQTFVDFFTVTVPGAFQAVKDWVTQRWPEIATLISGPFAPLVALATNGFGVRDNIIGAFKGVKDWMSDKFNAVQGLVTAPFTDAWNVINNIPGNIKTAFGKVGVWFNTAKDWAIKNLITSPFSDAWTFISGIPGKITGAFGGLGKPIAHALGAVGTAIVAVFKAPINAVISLIDAIKLPSGIHIKTWHGIPDGFSVAWSNPFNIPMLAAGGIVNSPTLAVIGEAGPEAVIPLSGAGAGGLGGGPVFSVTVNGVVGNERDVAMKIGHELQQLKNRGLSFGLA